MTRRPYRTLLLALALPLLGAGLGPGCARQSEGEPCDAQGQSDDCESGLACTDSTLLAESRGQDRCCPPAPAPIRDGRCTPGGGGGTGGTGGSGGEDAGETPDAGEDASGCVSPCNFTSDCAENQVCGPQGCCQAECQTDRDCTSPEVCVMGSCETAAPEPQPEPQPEPEPEAGTD
jgi:hypothetical protein